MTRFGFSLALLLAQLSFGCGDDAREVDDPTDAGEPSEAGSVLSTGASCDESLSYQNDIRPIVAAHCTRCHASTLKGAARNGAPSEYNFDSEAGILAAIAEIDQMAGSGPRLTNTVMPPSDPKPSVAQRATLSKYLACRL